MGVNLQQNGSAGAHGIYMAKYFTNHKVMYFYSDMINTKKFVKGQSIQLQQKKKHC